MAGAEHTEKGRGLFITVEGPDGAGKSTQIMYIQRFFAERNMDAVLTREPGGTAIGERIREILLDRRHPEMQAMTEAMLYAAARAQHVAQVIRPALDAGRIVICDRFVDSSIAYQGWGRALGQDTVEALNAFATKDCLPDLTFLLKVDPQEGRRRVRERVQEQASTADRLELEDDAFHRRVYEGYLALEARYPQRIVGLDASRPAEAIGRDIQDRLEEVVRRVITGTQR